LLHTCAQLKKYIVSSSFKLNNIEVCLKSSVILRNEIVGGMFLQVGSRVMWSKVNHLTAFEESARPVPNCLIRFDN